MSTPESFYVGDLWYVEAAVANAKTGLPPKADEVTVTGLVYSPAEWKEKTEEKTVTGKAVTFTEEAGEKGVYEALAVPELDEDGIWRIVVESSAPLKKVQPALITVQALSEL